MEMVTHQYWKGRGRGEERRYHCAPSAGPEVPDHCAPTRGWMEAASCHHASTARRGCLMKARRGHHTWAGRGPAVVQ
eukprot:722810-Prorocentrum_lima.AAC.1